MSVRWVFAAAFAAVVALVGPSMAQEPLSEDLRAFDPARDDPAVLAALAAEASRTGALPELRAWLDTLRVAGVTGRHALAYWGALSLQMRTDPDSVAAAFGRHLAAHPGDAEARAALVGVLEANAAIDEAETLRRRTEGGELAEAPANFAGAGGSILAELDDARRTGEPETVRRALARALAAGLPLARVAVLRGDLHLAGGTPDSAIGVWAAAVGAAPRPEALEALGRVRLVRSLQRAGMGGSFLTDLGRALVSAPADPAAAAARLDSLARALGQDPAAEDSTFAARSLLAGLAAERLGEAGEPGRASRALEAAARDAGPEAAGLLLSAGRWAWAAGEEERARELWRDVVRRHPGTPDDLEARRLLSAPGAGQGR